MLTIIEVTHSSTESGTERKAGDFFPKVSRSMVEKTRERRMQEASLKVHVIGIDEFLELMSVKNSEKTEHRHGFGVYFSQKNEHTKTIADHYGLRHQCRKLREELAELSEALEIHEEKPTASSKEAVLSEIADVVFLIRQIVYKGAIDPEAIEEMIAYKARRQLKRIAKEKQESESNRS